MDDSPRFKVHEKQGYFELMMDGLNLKHQEAAKDGSGEFLEDVIDMLWTSVPSGDKDDLRIKTWDRKGTMTATEAWEEAEACLPPTTLAIEDRKAHPTNRKRVKRKSQIVTDTLQALNLLYKKPPVGKMVPIDGAEEISWGDDAET